VVKEKIYLDKSNPDIMHNIITIIDNVFTHPWTVDKRYRRERNVAWFEDNCNENNHHVVIGKQNYYLNADDGLLMPARKDQAAPACAQADDVYAGKTINIYIGTGEGPGALTAYPRAIAQVIGRYIPGHPNFVIRYMPGAGGLKAANFLYGIAPQDGTAWGFITR